jgi:N-acyl-phosphatidylethanolamine-hydrolysing phospholipase D
MKRFSNPHATGIRRSLLDVLLWKLGYYDDPHPQQPPPQNFEDPLPKRASNDNQPTALWINHSTFLLRVDGMHILTDPIWSERCSPFSFLGPIRRHAPPFALSELPKIDIVLISHNHYDHLDKKTVLALFARNPEIIWVVPKGVKKWFAKKGITQVVELGWWEDALFPHFKVTAVPAQHFSGRTFYDLNRTLWAGFVVETPTRRFYFAGDTGYNEHDFKKVGEKWPKIDLSLIPIGSYVPRKFMAPVHIEPRDAVQIHKEVGSALSLAMHWKTFNLSDEPLHQPPYDLFLALQEKGLHPSSFLAPPPGYAIHW